MYTSVYIIWCEKKDVIHVNHVCVYFSGWYLVWKLFLSKFKFVQELLGKNEGEKEEVTTKKPRTKVRRD